MTQVANQPAISTSCLECGGRAELVRGPLNVPFGRRMVSVVTEFMKCSNCGEHLFVGDQAWQLERRAEEQVRREGGILPTEIRRLRKRLGFTQEAFEALLGCGDKTVSRWERGIVTPDSTTCMLLRLLEGGYVTPADIERTRRGLPPAVSASVTKDVFDSKSSSEGEVGDSSPFEVAWKPVSRGISMRGPANDNLALAA